MKRLEWLQLLEQMMTPLLENGAEGQLKKAFPIFSSVEKNFSRNKFSLLEVSARSLAGIAPWLALENLDGLEKKLQLHFRPKAQILVESIVDPESPDYANFSEGDQPLVDSAFLVQSLVRAPKILWLDLPMGTKRNLVIALNRVRAIPPKDNNWILFSALIEAFFCRLGLAFDQSRIDHALGKFDQWYLGDGFYSDGPEFHLDYYNSIVIHPMILDILLLTRQNKRWANFETSMLKRAQRYCVVLEKLIFSDGRLPLVGRSLTYRTGLLHVLGHLALYNLLPVSLPPQKVRSSMSAVLQRCMSYEGNYDNDGWLTVGYYGHQPELAENYISRGSLYAAALVFLPLGIHPEKSFWNT